MKEQWKKLDSDAKLLVNMEEGPINIQLPSSAFSLKTNYYCQRLLITLRVLVLLVLLIILGRTALILYTKYYVQNDITYDKPDFNSELIRNKESFRSELYQSIDEFDKNFDSNGVYTATESAEVFSFNKVTSDKTDTNEAIDNNEKSERYFGEEISNEKEKDKESDVRTDNIESDNIDNMASKDNKLFEINTIAEELEKWKDESKFQMENSNSKETLTNREDVSISTEDPGLIIKRWRQIEPEDIAVLIARRIESVMGEGDELLLWYYVYRDYNAYVTNQQNILKFLAAKVLYNTNISECSNDVDNLFELIADDSYTEDFMKLLDPNEEKIKPENAIQVKIVNDLKEKMKYYRLVKDGLSSETASWAFENEINHRLLLDLGYDFNIFKLLTEKSAIKSQEKNKYFNTNYKNFGYFNDIGRFTNDEEKIKQENQEVESLIKAMKKFAVDENSYEDTEKVEAVEGIKDEDISKKKENELEGEFSFYKSILDDESDPLSLWKLFSDSIFNEENNESDQKFIEMKKSDYEENIKSTVKENKSEKSTEMKDYDNEESLEKSENEWVNDSEFSSKSNLFDDDAIDQKNEDNQDELIEYNNESNLETIVDEENQSEKTTEIKDYDSEENFEQVLEDIHKFFKIGSTENGNDKYFENRWKNINELLSQVKSLDDKIVDKENKENDEKLTVVGEHDNKKILEGTVEEESEQNEDKLLDATEYNDRENLDSIVDETDEMNILSGIMNSSNFQMLRIPESLFNAATDSQGEKIENEEEYDNYADYVELY